MYPTIYTPPEHQAIAASQTAVLDDTTTDDTYFEQTDSLPVDVPPSFTPPPIATNPAPRRWGRAALIAFLIVALLASGIGIGVIASARRGTTASTSATTGQSINNSTSSVTLPATVQDLQQTIITVTKAVQPSVVEITSSANTGTAIGSGEFLTKDGYIVTNDHVVAGYSSYEVTLSNGTNYTATLIGQDAQDDLAVLKISITNATPISFADSSQASVGEFVLAIGNPLGLQESATFGIVSATNRTEAETATTAGGISTTLTGLIQTSAAINPGNSGGALVTLQGQLVGIPTLGATSTSQGETVSGIGFAIPANRVVYVVNQLMQSGYLTSTGRGFLGIQGQDAASLSNSGTAQGVVVEGFANDAAGVSPAQTAGLQTGDTITAVNGQTIASSTDLAGAILNQAPGTTVTLTVLRGTSTLTLHVTLGEEPLG
jgi:putative serine protease PepD